jgi:hypothetical protein
MSTVTLTQQRSAAPVAQTISAPAASPRPIPREVSTVPTPTHIKIDDEWFDLTSWKKTHPGGPLILEQMHGNDATGEFLPHAPPRTQVAALALRSGKTLCQTSLCTMCMQRTVHPQVALWV